MSDDDVLRFKNGTPVPDDEVMYNPDVDKNYGEAFQESMRKLMDELQKVRRSAEKADELPVLTDSDFDYRV